MTVLDAWVAVQQARYTGNAVDTFIHWIKARVESRLGFQPDETRLSGDLCVPPPPQSNPARQLDAALAGGW